MRGRRAGGSVKPIPDAQIDFSDIPESSRGRATARASGRQTGQRHGEAVDRHSSLAAAAEPASQDGR